MENFEYQRRTYLLFGRGRENEVGSLAKFEGGHRVLIHYSNEEMQGRIGLLDRVRRSLDRAGLEIFELSNTDDNPKAELVYEGIDFCRKEQIDFIIAVGKSSIIDTAKAIGVGALYKGDFWDFFSNVREPMVSLGVGAIVTTPDAGAECSSTCMLVRNFNGVNRKIHKASYAFLPRFAILNPELTFNISGKVSAVSCMDMITHVIARYFTNTPHVELTDELCESVLRTVIKMLPIISNEPNNYDARANIMLAGTLAQNGLCGLGREADFATHILELELSSRYNTVHGEGLAVLLPAWMTFCLNHNVMRMAQFAHRVFGIPINYENPIITARSGIEAFRNFLKSSGLPQNFFEMGLPMVDIVELVENLGLQEGDKIGSYVKLDKKACEAIYTMAYTYRSNRIFNFG